MTKQFLACSDSGAFSEKFLRALFFCSAPNMKEAPSSEGASLVSATPPIGKAPGAGTGDGGGVASESLERS